jgi:ribonuclease BN (tRNA processing enzyme)
LDALWFSHMHPDHAGDLPALANWLLNRPDDQPPFTVYGPPGWMDRLTAFLPTHPELLRAQINGCELYDGHVVTVGDLRLTSRVVRHTVPTYGLRIELGSHVLAYSGDTGPCSELDELASGADLFVCEAGTSTQPKDREPAHCTPEDAARTAQQANARHLLLTHIAPALDPAAAVARAASIHGGTAFAISGSTYEV